MFCSNCGTRLENGVNFCPNCGAKVSEAVVKAAATGVDTGNMVMLVSLGDCARATASALLQRLCGYDGDEALLIIDNLPITVARGLNDAQARYLAQAFAEYGLEVSVYDGTGWREWESPSTSVWDQAGALLAGVASALGLISVNNRITRDMMHRTDFPYRYAGPRPPVYRLNSALRTVPPRHVAPASVRPPVRHAPPSPPPRPTPPPARPAPPPARPTPPPARPASVSPKPVPPSPARPVPTPRPAPPRLAPQPARPTPQPRPAPQTTRPGGPVSHPGEAHGPGGHGNGFPGGRPGGGTGRRG